MAVFLIYFDSFVDGPIYLLNRRKKKKKTNKHTQVSHQIDHVFFSAKPTIRYFVNIFLTANTDLFYIIYFSFSYQNDTFFHINIYDFLQTFKLKRVTF